MIRLCKNETTDALREHFGAFPLRIPEERIQPGFVIAKKGSEPLDMRGMLQQILVGRPKVELRLNNSPLAQTEFKQTRAIDAGLGGELLEGFFKGMGLSSAPVAAKSVSARNMRFSFGNVRRRWWDKNELGTALYGHALDLEHPSVRGIFTGPDAHELLLVTDAIVSRSITIHTDSNSSQTFNASLDVLKNYIAGANLDLSVSTTSDNTISFEGKNYLTFAFSCVELNIDSTTGKIGVGRSRNDRNAGLKGGVESPPPPVVLDADGFMPGMLEFR